MACRCNPNRRNHGRHVGNKCRDRPFSWIPNHAECWNGPLDVLELEPAAVFKGGLHAAGHGLLHCSGDQDTSGRSLLLKPRRDVHGVTIEVIAVHDEVTKVKADPEHNRHVLRLAAIGLDHHLLEFDGCSQRVHCAGELDQSAIARQLDQPPAMAGY